MSGPPPVARAVRAALAALAVLAAGACGDDSPRDDAVDDLVLPTAEEREADDALRAAETFLDAGRSRQAEPLLRRACELRPEHARALLLLGQALYDRGEFVESAEFLRRAVAAEPQNRATHSLLAAALVASGRPKLAEDACEAWTAAVPDDDEAWYQLGTVRASRGKYGGAAAALRTAMGKRTSRPDIRSQLGLVLLAQGSLDEAEARQREAIERRQDYADAWFRLGDVISRRGPERLNEAVAAFERAVDLEPQMILAHLYLYRLCRLAEAPDAERLAPRGETAWRQVLRLHGRRQLAAPAAAAAPEPRDAGTDAAPPSEYALREAVALAPQDPAPRLELARHLQRERRLDEAADAFRRAIECGAAGWEVQTDLARTLLAADDPAAAEPPLRDALRLAPSEPVPHRLLAWTLLLRDRADDAIAAADAGLAVAADDALLKKTRALARMRRGELDEGLQDVAAAGWLD